MANTNTMMDFTSLRTKAAIWQSAIAKLEAVDNQPNRIAQSVIAQSSSSENYADEIWQKTSAKSLPTIGQPLAAQFQPPENQRNEISQSVSDQLGASPEKVLSYLSFSHISQPVQNTSP